MAADEGLARVLNEAYLKLTDVRTKAGEPIDPDAAWTFSMYGLERLCELEREGDEGSTRVYETLAALDRDALELVAVNAITGLAKTGWRIPRVTCPRCGSEAVDTNSDDPAPGVTTCICADCGHEWELNEDDDPDEGGE